ncbi:MAG: N-acetylmuramoyl-L-alanine amidase [Clostridia bacterium]|nr:N-acetylmuramoyl-L-alanine amidase [Clostridia bacterium]
MSKVLIGLDAGHGGSSSGTYSVNTTKDGLYEKDYALELVKKINERLLANGFKTFLTRTADVNPGTVSERAAACAKAGCRYAVSVHFNAGKNSTPNGVEVFVPYAEKGAGIEAGFNKYLGEIFNLRKPFARSNNYYNRNCVMDKKLNLTTRKFDAVSNDKDYFGFVRTAWEKGLSADLLEVCFLTNKNDFETYIKNKDAVADAIARSIVEGYGETYIGAPQTETPKAETTHETIYRVQVGAFSVKENAEKLLNQLKAAGFTGFITGGKNG